jgi:surface protein
MLQNATKFNQDMSNFDIANVSDLSHFFHGARSFNNGQNLSLTWDVSRVVDMTSLFEETSFVGDLSTWNTAAVTSFSRMFANNLVFHGVTISNWYTGSAIDMSGFFDGCVNFRGDVSSFNTSNVQDMSGMFRGASSWASDISGWNVRQVTDMSNQFDGCAFFNIDLERWDTSDVKSMSGQFRGATSFIGMLSTWDTSKVKDFSYQFDGATRFDGAVGSWDISQAKDISGMFRGASLFNRDLSSWAVDNVLEMSETFKDATDFHQTLCWTLDQRATVTDMFLGSQGCLDVTCIGAEDLYADLSCSSSYPPAVSSESGGTNTTGDNTGLDTGDGVAVSKVVSGCSALQSPVISLGAIALLICGRFFVDGLF